MSADTWTDMMGNYNSRNNGGGNMWGALASVGSGLLGGLFGSSSASKQRQQQMDMMLKQQAFDSRQNALNRALQSEQFGQQFGLEQDRFGFDKRRYGDDLSNRNRINTGLLEQIGNLRGLVGQPTMNQEQQNTYVNSQMEAMRPQQQRYGSIIAKTLGVDTPQGQRAIAGNLMNAESGIRANLADRLLQMDSQRDMQYQGLIANLLGSQRG